MNPLCIILLLATVQSVIRRSWFFVLQMEKSKQSTWMWRGRIALSRKRESPVLLGEERKKRQRAQWVQVESTGRGSVFLFSRSLKPTLPHRRAGPGGSHPKLTKWGEAWGVPDR
jgi:hypothetical protein